MFNLTIDQAAELFRPDDLYVVQADETYTDFYGLRVQYSSDNYIPTLAELVAVDFSNLTTIDLWHRYGLPVGKDFISVRAKIFGLVVAAGGFANLSAAEKKLAAEYFVVDRADRLTIFQTQEGMEEAGIEYHDKSKAARQKRYDRSIIHVYNTISQPDANAVAATFFGSGVSDLYIESGVRGSLWGDPGLDGILDYVNATETSNFASNGLRISDVTPQSGTLDELCDEIIAIIMEDLV